MIWESKWNWARLLRKDDKTKKAQKLLQEADYILETEKYYVLFRTRVKAKKVEMPIFVEPSLHRRIKELAREKGLSMSQLVNKLVQEYEGLPNVDYGRLIGGRKKSAILRFYTDEETRQKIEDMAEKLSVSMSDVIRAILEEKLEVEYDKA